jgi:hypothetical protein
MKETINFLHEQVRALQRKVNKLEQENSILFDYTDCKMVEGCEEATRIINNLIE